MKATIMNGMHAGDGVIETIHAILLDELQARNWQITAFKLHEMDIRPCLGCFGCWIQTPGRCIMPDTDEIAQAMIRSELFIFLTPVTFGGYSSELKKAIDHIISNIQPFFETVQGETHHRPRYDYYPNLLIVGTLPQHDPESEEIFRKLAERNALNMYPEILVTEIITYEQDEMTMKSLLQNALKQIEVAL